MPALSSFGKMVKTKQLAGLEFSVVSHVRELSCLHREGKGSAGSLAVRGSSCMVWRDEVKLVV